MEIYKLEFNFFCGCEWADKTVEITAINKFQLIRAFLNETRHYNGNKTIKQLWKDNIKYIQEDILTFPIIFERT